MNTQPEALRLADWCENDAPTCLTTHEDVAAELRRLHALNQELLEALKEIVQFMRVDFDDLPMAEKVRAAIAKAEVRS